VKETELGKVSIRHGRTSATSKGKRLSARRACRQLNEGVIGQGVALILTGEATEKHWALRCRNASQLIVRESKLQCM
jgi:hypothetical protein